VTATRCATGWGGNIINPRIADVVAEQKTQWSAVAGNDNAFLDEFGPKGAPVSGKLADTSSLQKLLGQTATAGRFPDGKGPWSWLTNELFYRSWLPAALEPAMSALVKTDGDAEVRAFLDWTSEQCDLWRFVTLLEGWNAKPPTWWPHAADKKPTGWQQSIRPSDWSDITTLGDVSTRTLASARAQAATPPRVDLAPRP
jgi:hypothetical protein